MPPTKGVAGAPRPRGGGQGEGFPPKTTKALPGRFAIHGASGPGPSVVLGWRHPRDILSLEHDWINHYTAIATVITIKSGGSVSAAGRRAVAVSAIADVEVPLRTAPRKRSDRLYEKFFQKQVIRIGDNDQAVAALGKMLQDLIAPVSHSGYLTPILVLAFQLGCYRCRKILAD